MELAGQILFSIYVVLIAATFVCGGWFLAYLWFAKSSPLSDGPLPKTAVHLPIRGLDPDLKNCLLRLLRQDYPNYELHICMHSDDDPAWPTVRAAIAETGATNVRVDLYRSEFDPMQLQCPNAKTVQGVYGLDDSFEYIVSTVGSLYTHPSWLRELISPMVQDPTIGATFGNRWFMPAQGNWGSLMRHLWSVASVPIMYFGNMPWGGCLATRLSAARQPGVLEEWQRTLAIDAATPRQLAKQALKVRFVPKLLMINRDECDVPFYINFVQRQLTWTRVYHDNWPAVVIHAALFALVLIAPVGVILAAALTGDFRTAFTVAGAFAVFQASLLLFVLMSDFVLRKSSSSYRNNPVGWLSWRVLLRMPVALLLTQLSHPFTVWRAVFERRVVWRGLTYEIVGRNDIRNAHFVVPSDTEDRFAAKAM